MEFLRLLLGDFLLLASSLRSASSESDWLSTRLLLSSRLRKTPNQDRCDFPLSLRCSLGDGFGVPRTLSVVCKQKLSFFLCFQHVFSRCGHVKMNRHNITSCVRFTWESGKHQNLSYSITRIVRKSSSTHRIHANHTKKKNIVTWNGHGTKRKTSKKTQISLFLKAKPLRKCHFCLVSF